MADRTRPPTPLRRP